MLDLDTIFDPDRVEAAVRNRSFKWNCGIGPDDLPGDWRIEWEERAAIMEFHGGLHRERAEAEALTDIIDQMRREGIALTH